MTVSATPQLRPLGIAKLLDQTLRIYRNNFFKFIGIIAIILVPLTLLQMGSSLLMVGSLGQSLNSSAPATDPFSIFGPGYFLGIAGSLLYTILLMILIYGVAAAAIAQIVAGTYTGQNFGILESYGNIKNNWGRLLLAFIILLPLMGVSAIWMILPCIGQLTGGPGIFLYMVMVIMPIIAPVIVLEQNSGLGIRRAWDLTRRRFWWVAGFALLLTLLGQIIILGPTYLVTALLTFFLGTPFMADDPSTLLTVQTAIQSLTTMVFSLIYFPLLLIGMDLLYLDLRVRTEGLDLLFQSTANEQITLADMAAQAPPPDQGNFITWTEIGYFVLATIAAIALFVVLYMILLAFIFVIIAAAGAPF